jgi:hypothetical protein
MSSSDRQFGAAFYKNLSGASALKLYLAIFFVFAPLALITAAGPARGWPLWLTLVWLLGSGLIAVGYAAAFTRSLRYLYAVIPLQVVVGVASSVLMVKSGVGPATITFGGLICVAFTVAGYVFFIMFINREGGRSLRLQTEIGLAQEIHSHLVPTISLRTPKLSIFGQSISSTEVGGDLVDVVQDGTSTALFVADVSGHGVKAGVFMSMVKSAMRMKLLHSGHLEELCADLNRVVFQVKQPEMFVTFAAMRFLDAGRVEFVLAGHPSILHYQRATSTISELQSVAPPLGVLEEIPFSSNRVETAPGDLFVLLTDGLIEIAGEWDPRMGMERIKKMLSDTAHLPVEEAHARILREVRVKAQADDDQTLLLARVN